MTENITGKVVLHDLATLARDLGLYLSIVGKKLYLKLKSAINPKDPEKSDEKKNKKQVPEIAEEKHT